MVRKEGNLSVDQFLSSQDNTKEHHTQLRFHHAGHMLEMNDIAFVASEKIAGALLRSSNLNGSLTWANDAYRKGILPPSGN